MNEKSPLPQIDLLDQLPQRKPMSQEEIKQALFQSILSVVTRFEQKYQGDKNA